MRADPVGDRRSKDNDVVAVAAPDVTHEDDPTVPLSTDLVNVGAASVVLGLR
jgi:hypothetical protein